MCNHLINIFRKELCNKIYLKFLLWFAILIFAVLSSLRFFYNLGLFMDTIEHIHASYLISTGLVPYRDFFEHHHPFLWYLILPIVTLFDRDINIVYIARGIAISGYFLFLYFFYKIAKQLTHNRNGGRIAVLAFLSISKIWYDIQTLRPDIFMYISILIALIYFFDYLDSLKRRYLCYSYFWWLIAFLFLQKAAIGGIGFVFANIWLYYNKRIKMADILIASIFPLLSIIGLLFTLYLTDSLSSWWLYNFTFNTYVQAYYGNYSSGLSYLPILSFVFAIFTIRQYRATEKSIIILFIWVCLALQLLYFAPHPQYYFLYLTFSILLLAPYLLQLFCNYFLPFMITLVFCLGTSFSLNYDSYDSKGKVEDMLQMMEYITQHTPSEDKLQTYPYSYNLFNQDIDYYWFGFNNVVIIADLYLSKGFDYNEVIKKHQPKFITYSDMAMDMLMYQSSQPLLFRNRLLLQKAAKGDVNSLNKLSNINLDYWNVDMDYIKQHYKLLRSYDSIQLWERIDD
ncbi:MAG: glycosyltransferase family 39 protein [Acetobacter sp.]|nr:glycosyltransferase family 39 protein [Acetobacter sp.]